jgi:hypothetical protein
MIELFFRFTIKGTGLRNNILCFSTMWRSAVYGPAVDDKFHNYEKLVLHREPSLCRFKNCYLLTVNESSLDQN